MHRRGCGLDDIAVLAADGRVQFDKKVLVGKLDHIPAAKFQAEFSGDLLGQIQGCRAGKEVDIPVE